ncbi:alkaline dihydroceramidase Ecym_7059 [Eremothecium cymbalariae DBVPG|uniref:Alkaline ceramidase n=1 Tax=Eremothecium cymbalariae (strain CBS 270.75 / DBVPG 7215 / KCTC 17166 / NRRL Y-17582) TaxID=931890 RepID=G8JVP7_ERECY|nr:hypothetical protein Ecym_7059 [Eremothecium cymbalariae DBVPG\
MFGGLLAMKPYPEPLPVGFWGEPTSTIDWCEENYVLSYYVAEWSNTITNSVFIIQAVYLTYSSIRHKLEKRFILTSLGFGLVGIGSWLFHMTLRYEFQLLDELPMVYATCVPTWSVMCEQELVGEPRRIGTVLQRKRWLIGASIFAGALALTCIYMWIYTDPFIHELAYALVTVYVVIYSAHLGRKYITDSKEWNNLRTCMVLGVTTFVTAYILWQFDVHACNFWIRIRRDYLMLPFGTLLELHAWWHVLTGTGVYYYVVYLIYLRQLLHNRRDKYMLIWRWKIFPEVVHNDNSLCQNYSLGFLGPLQSRATKKSSDHQD